MDKKALKVKRVIVKVDPDETKAPSLKVCPFCGYEEATREVQCKICLGNPRLVEVRR